MMGVDAARPNIGVVPGNHVAAAVADERHSFLDGARRTGGLDHDIDALTVRQIAHHQINRKHLEIRGCWGSEPRHFLRALSILERHPSIPFRRIGARLYGLGQLNDALADAEAMRIPKALVDPSRLGAA